MNRFSGLSLAVGLIWVCAGSAQALAASNSCSDIEAEYPNYAFYRDAARVVYENLTQTTANLSAQSKEDIVSLAEQPGGALAAKNDGTSSQLETQSEYENALSAIYSQPFSQPNNVVTPGYPQGAPVEGARDVYTFCPPGSQVVREVTQSRGIVNPAPKYYWGYSQCQLAGSRSAAPTEVRIQGLWVSNDKKPVLTLELTGADYENGGGHPRVGFDIKKLLAGKVSFNDVFKAMWPSKHSVPPADCTGADPAESGALVQSLDGSDAVLEKLSGSPANPASPASNSDVKPDQGYPVELPAATAGAGGSPSSSGSVGR